MKKLRLCFIAITTLVCGCKVDGGPYTLTDHIIGTYVDGTLPVFRSQPKDHTSLGLQV